MAPPALGEFDELVAQARAAARQAGLKPTDVRRALAGNPQPGKRGQAPISKAPVPEPGQPRKSVPVPLFPFYRRRNVPSQIAGRFAVHATESGEPWFSSRSERGDGIEARGREFREDVVARQEHLRLARELREREGSPATGGAAAAIVLRENVKRKSPAPGRATRAASRTAARNSASLAGEVPHAVRDDQVEDPVAEGERRHRRSAPSGDRAAPRRARRVRARRRASGPRGRAHDAAPRLGERDRVPGRAAAEVERARTGAVRTRARANATRFSFAAPDANPATVPGALHGEPARRVIRGW